MGYSYGYEYGTSPRKLEPEYRQPKKKKTVPKKKKVQSKSTKKSKAKKKRKMSVEAVIVIHSVLIFCVIFAVIAGETLVTQKYKEKQGLEKEYSELMSAAGMSSGISDDIRSVASEYGMQTKSATLVNLETSDYIESASEKVQTEDGNVWDKLVQFIKNIF